MSFVPPTVTDSAYGYLLGRQISQDRETAQTNQSLQQWIDYARGLEHALREHKEEIVGQAAIKKAALEEISRVDPNNSLLKQEVRNDIFEKAVEEAKKDGKLD